MTIQSISASLRLTACGKTDLGLRRKNNEDVYYLDPAIGFFLVADGMGGAAAGEIASKIFCDSALSILDGSASRSEKEATTLVKQAFSLSNSRILQHVLKNPEHTGMGCTAELLLFCENGFVIGHVGDSRTYRLRRQTLKQLTCDHSLVQQQLALGLINEEQARRHPLRNVITRSIGNNEQLALDLVRGPAFASDCYLLCSDGLTDMILDRDIHETLASTRSLPDKATELINRANVAGGPDNITVVLIQIAK